MREHVSKEELGSVTLWGMLHGGRGDNGNETEEVEEEAPRLELDDVCCWSPQHQAVVAALAKRYEVYLEEQKRKAAAALLDAKAQAKRRAEIEEEQRRRQRQREKDGEKERKNKKTTLVDGDDDPTLLPNPVSDPTTDPATPTPSPTDPKVDPSLPKPPLPAKPRPEGNSSDKAVADAAREARRKTQLKELDDAMRKKKKKAQNEREKQNGRSVTPEVAGGGDGSDDVTVVDHDDGGHLFESTTSSLPVSLHDKCVGWRKAAAELGIKELSALPSDLSLQTGGGRFAAEDISQGQLGDCWLLSALSLLALSPDSGLLEKVFSENPTATPDGKYVVLLHKQGKWVRVQVNDELPVNSRNELLLVRSAGGDELWPMLLEKVGTYNVAGKGCNISKHHLKKM